MIPNGFSTVNPFSLKKLCHYTYADSQKIENVLSAAHFAWKTWKESPRDERIGFFFRLASELRQNIQPLAQLITDEMGKPMAESVAEIEKSISACEYYAQHLEVWMQEHIVDAHRKVLKQSSGPVLAIMPWNFPIWQVIRCAIPVIAAGNSVVLKHSDLVAGTAEFLAKIFLKAQGDTPLLQQMHITHQQANAVISDLRIRSVSFTGSRKGGSSVAASAGQSIKKSILELGGSDPYIVFKDADLKLAAQAMAKSRLQNNGQSCIAAKRFLVDRSVASEFLPLLQNELSQYPDGDPKNQESKRGPLAHERFHNDLTRQVRDLIKMGAQLVFESDVKNANFYPVQCLQVDTQSIKYYPEELFGPVALLSFFDHEQEAIDMANHPLFGLGAAVFSSNDERAKRVAEKLECGMICINGMLRSQVDLPFGGVKESGYGRELSELGLLEFINYKSIHQI